MSHNESLEVKMGTVELVAKEHGHGHEQQRLGQLMMVVVRRSCMYME